MTKRERIFATGVLAVLGLTCAGSGVAEVVLPELAAGAQTGKEAEARPGRAALLILLGVVYAWLAIWRWRL